MCRSIVAILGALWLALTATAYGEDAIASHSQIILSNNLESKETHFSAKGDLNVLFESHFTDLSHPAFPKHNVRIKKSSFCDGTVKCESTFLARSVADASS